MARPTKYTLEELRVLIIKYREYCKDNDLLPNKAGLCLYLDIHRDTYCEYKKDGHEFADAIKEVEVAIEEAWVQRLMSEK